MPWDVSPPDPLHKGLGDYIDRTPKPSPVLMARELRAARVIRPAEMIAVTDSTADGLADFITVAAHYDPRVRPGTVHNGGANVLFCDGHVQWYLFPRRSVRRRRLRPRLLRRRHAAHRREQLPGACAAEVAAKQRAPSVRAARLVRPGTLEKPGADAPPPGERDAPPAAAPHSVSASSWRLISSLLPLRVSAPTQPKTIMFCWELGDGLGHMMQMLPLAEAMVKRGHRVLVALRQFRSAAAVFGGAGVAFLEAPAWHADAASAASGRSRNCSSTWASATRASCSAAPSRGATCSSSSSPT